MGKDFGCLVQNVPFAISSAGPCSSIFVYGSDATMKWKILMAVMMLDLQKKTMQYRRTPKFRSWHAGKRGSASIRHLVWYLALTFFIYIIKNGYITTRFYCTGIIPVFNTIQSSREPAANITHSYHFLSFYLCCYHYMSHRWRTT